MTVLAIHPGSELFGSDRMLLETVRGLRAEGCEVIVAVPSPGPMVPELLAAGARVVVVPMLVLRKASLRPGRWPVLLRDALRGAGAAWRLLRRVRPDVVYVSTIIIPQWLLMARVLGIPTVSHVHEAEVGRVFSRALYFPQLLSQIVIVNSRFTLGAVVSAFPSIAERTRVIYNGVASPEAPSRPRDPLSGVIHVVYVGRLSPRKGPDLIIEAASLIASSDMMVDVVFVGAEFAGYEWYADELRAQAESSPEAVSVRFVGFQTDVWPHLARADVLVVPSRDDESFGNAAVEGILALRPVIASDSSGLREAVEGYDAAQLIPADDAVALADAIRRALETWPHLVDGIEEDRRRALRRHSPVIYRKAVAQTVLATATISPSGNAL